MAIVPDLSGNSPGVDYALSSPNRRVDGDPNGTVVSLFSGEIVFDTVGVVYYRANSSNTADEWVLAELDV